MNSRCHPCGESASGLQCRTVETVTTITAPPISVRIGDLELIAAPPPEVAAAVIPALDAVDGVLRLIQLGFLR